MRALLVSALVAVAVGVNVTSCPSRTSISASELRCVFTQLPSSDADNYAHHLSYQLGPYVTNKCAWAALLGNIGTESAGLTEWTQSPCGMTYCGRGPLQITGHSNYLFCSRQSMCGCSSIVGTPTSAASDVGVGFGTAACVWDKLSGHNLSNNADGSLDGFRETVCYINAGHSPCSPNGWSSRQAYWNRANKCL
eukprot:TRINITY_DN47747_c0_g1_i1.p2 TRINITY_DN47747_c0_g1~~TRINITY_DN47747_c0_g1_i1.p2  ORF type:complete len:194 (+),score=15.99 TRINITY_DN47747_c0_g1_i1:72-653(+)